MQHVPTTIDEQIIAKSIQEECTWENIPKRLQILLSSKEEWHKKVKEHCIKKRVQWSDCFARKTCKESEYYEDMMRYLRKNLALFPFHLAEYVCRIMRISPFRYYCDMLYEVMKNEQPYDRIPNFSAADALRLTGIGRNEFIDIMNKCRSKKIMWKLNKSIVKELLPTQPVDFPIEPWWGVCLVNFTLEEFRKLTEEEMSTIDKICKEEANSFVLFDPEIIRGLYRRGLVYFDVPVYPDDRLKVSKLQGFVSNREQSYEDPTEEILYALFVVSSEHATVAELATTLQADLRHLQAAASIACRLGWAIKVIDPAAVLQESSMPGSPSSLINDDDDGASLTSLGAENPLSRRNSDFQADVVNGDILKVASSSARVAFIVDANITSYLMMGSLSPGLKSHAVTLYEAGKLDDTSVAELCKDLLTLEGTKFEGELQEFANHAFSLRCALECLRSGGLTIDTSAEDVVDLIDLHSSTGGFGNGENLQNSTRSLNGLEEIQSNGPGSQDLHLSLSESRISQTANQPIASSQTANLPEFSTATENSSVCFPDQLTKAELGFNNQEATSLRYIETTASAKNHVKRKRKYRVDLLRCESLAGLAPATLNRLFRRDYDIIVSMVPLPSTPSTILPGGASHISFGPPSYAALTPWLKLTLYTAAGSGPLSIVLMKGQRLRILPPPLAICEKALMWAWDGSTVGGLGGKFDGTLVNGSILLHCLNSLLRYSAVLVQPLLKVDLDKSGMPITKDIPLPLINLDGSYAKDIGLSNEEITQLNSTLTNLVKELQLWTIGYIRVIKVHKMDVYDNFSAKITRYEWVPLSLEFGIPLFSPELCRTICNRVIQSQLLQAYSLSEHREAMQKLRKRLHDFCAEYHATGPIAKNVYAREQTQDASPQLTSYASGRWNSIVEPLDPITPGTENEPESSKYFEWQRQHSEIISFNGVKMRSYALTPVYEPGTRSAEGSSTTLDATSGTKPENSDDYHSNDVILPGVNLLFDGSSLHPFDIGTCLQGRLPVSLIAEASTASVSLQTRRN